MGTEEEDFAQQVADALENIDDVEEVELLDESTTVRVTMASGDRFRVRVRKVEEDD